MVPWPVVMWALMHMVVVVLVVAGVCGHCGGGGGDGRGHGGGWVLELLLVVLLALGLYSA